MALNDPVISNVNGTTDNAFRIADGTSGIAGENTLALQNTEGGVLKLFKADGATLATLQVGTPFNNNDVATKSYVDTAPVVDAAEQIIAIPFNNATGATSGSTYQLPDNSYVTKVSILVITPFDGTAPTVSVGYTGQTTKFLAAAGSNLKVAGIYTREQFTVQNSGTDKSVLLTYVDSDSNNGSAVALVWFVISPRS